MKKHFIWLVAIGVVTVSILAGTLVYISHFASAVSQAHTASGPIILSPTATGATETSTSSTNSQTFQIVPTQTKASYRRPFHFGG